MAAQPDPFLSAVRAIQNWTSSRPVYTDVALAAIAGALSLAELTSTAIGTTRNLDLLGWLLVATSATALIWRRTAPLRVLLIVVAALLTFYLRGYGSFLSAIGLFCMYSVAVHANDRKLAWKLAPAFSVLLLVVAFFTVISDIDANRLSGTTSMGLSLVCALAGGGVVRNRNEIFVSAQQRADTAEADRKAEARRAVASERLRIAREMHDVVAHGMSVITVQAAAGQAIAASKPERTVEILQSIEATSRESLNEMRRMLGVLRGDKGTSESSDATNPSDLAPQPTIRDLASLIENCNNAGISTELAVVGEPRSVGAGVELAAYRIVQEALTNVIKHGGGTATAKVTVTYSGSNLALKIADSGRGAVSNLSASGDGNGLIGMRERVEAYRGSFRAGPASGGGFQVQASLPVDARPAVGATQLSGSKVQEEGQQ